MINVNDGAKVASVAIMQAELEDEDEENTEIETQEIENTIEEATE